MNEKVSEFFYEYPFEFGSFFIILGAVLLYLRMINKVPSKMKDHTISSWKYYVNSWAFIIMLALLGLFLVFRG